jgi:hypothetical protein
VTPDAPEGTTLVGTAIVAQGCDHCGGPLPRRAKRFCSDTHRKLWWEARHPRLPDKPRSQDAGPLIPRIRELFKDGCWRTDREAAAALGVLEGSFAARRRETGWPRDLLGQQMVRSMGRDFDGKPFRIGYGWIWETRRRIGSREREHRLVT